jgi:hypothetical protein
MRATEASVVLVRDCCSFLEAENLCLGAGNMEESQRPHCVSLHHSTSCVMGPSLSGPH